MEAAATAARETYLSGRGERHLTGWLSYLRILGKSSLASSDPEAFCDLLFARQREDGFVPAPGSDYHQAVSIPVQGFLLERLLHASRKSAAFLTPALRLAFFRAMNQHRYLYAHRDPAQEGLPVIQFPEEDGFGNSPNYDFETGHETLIQDPFFNTCLTLSNEALIAIGHFLGEDVLEVMHWHELTIHVMNEKLWDERAGQYQAHDIKKQCTIPVNTLAGMLPLAAEVPTQEQAERMLKGLMSETWGAASGDYFLFPSCKPDAAFTDFFTGWRGPVWPALNWMMHHGLMRYDFAEIASKVRGDSLKLIAEYGFHDAFDPRLSREGHPGIGSPSSPTAAALALHWLLK